MLNRDKYHTSLKKYIPVYLIKFHVIFHFKVFCLVSNKKFSIFVLFWKYNCKFIFFLTIGSTLPLFFFFVIYKHREKLKSPVEIVVLSHCLQLQKILVYKAIDALPMWVLIEVALRLNQVKATIGFVSEFCISILQKQYIIVHTCICNIVVHFMKSKIKIDKSDNTIFLIIQINYIYRKIIWIFNSSPFL